MKYYHIVEDRQIKPPYSFWFNEMLTTEKQLSVELPLGGIGYILDDMVIAPFFFNESMIAKKDGHDIVLTYLGTSKFAISYFQLPFGVPFEPIRFRSDVVDKDTFLFRVSEEINLCYAKPVKKAQGTFEVNCPDDFCPVFDRFAHLVGFNIGKLHDKHTVVSLKQLINKPST